MVISGVVFAFIFSKLESVFLQALFFADAKLAPIFMAMQNEPKRYINFPETILGLVHLLWQCISFIDILTSTTLLFDCQFLYVDINGEDILSHVTHFELFDTVQYVSRL